jgi:hypothetical protein
MPWISSRELKIYLLVVGIVTFVALFITIVVMLPGYIRYSRSIKDSGHIVEKQIDKSRFIIPESYMKFRDENWIPFRPDKERWTSIDTGPYWEDPEILILEYLEKQNENLINELFEDIP